MLLNTWIESVKHSHVKRKYTINKNIKKKYKYLNLRHKKHLIDISFDCNGCDKTKNMLKY